MVAVAGHGGYVPLYRIQRGRIAEQYGGSADGEIAVPGHDENHVTMASEAAELALERSGFAGPGLDAVFSASVTDPFAEHGIAAHVAYRVGATGDVRTGDLRATPRAATDAFFAARDFVRANDGVALVVGVDAMPAEPGSDEEQYAGAAAGALVVMGGRDDPVGTVASTGLATTGFVERHRRHGAGAEASDPAFERKHGFDAAVRPAIERALASTNESPKWATVSAPDQRMSQQALGRLPDEVTHVTSFDSVGYAGAGSFYLDVVHLLEEAEPDETAIAVAYGAGGADAVTIETGAGRDVSGMTVAKQIESKEHLTYAKHLELRERVSARGVSQ